MSKTPKLKALLKQIEPKQGDAPHMIVVALAGTGKTTTLVEGVKCIKGLPTTVIPSPQQRAVWEAMAMGPKPGTIAFCAFNASIAAELKRRLPPGCDAMTLHSLGNRAVTKNLGRQEPNDWVIEDIIVDLLGTEIRTLRKDKPIITTCTKKLVSLCKMNLVDPSEEGALQELAGYYEVFDEEVRSKDREEVYSLVLDVLQRCRDPRGKITFDDMIWLPVALGLSVSRYDLLLVDEAQDLNRCQQQLALLAGRRLILCGDPKQAIYGFAGADSESMGRMEQTLSGNIGNARDGRCCLVPAVAQCVTLPLTVTRRCGKAIVEEAKRIVPEFEAHENNPAGAVGEAKYPVQYDDDREYLLPIEKTYVPMVVPGDMVLCRVNAPLIRECFRFLKLGKKANIQGRDVGKGLTRLVDSMVKRHEKENGNSQPMTISELTRHLTDWQDEEVAKEQAKSKPSEGKLITIQDKVECLFCFMEGASTVADVRTKIEQVFTDDQHAPGIRLSSIHKAKGLEAPNVFFLMPRGGQCPHPCAKSTWQREQELNLKYVGITRAIHKLTYVY